MFLSLGVDAFVEYSIGGTSFFFLKDVVNILVVFMALIGLRLKFLTKSVVFLITMYSMFLSIMISFPVRNSYPDFDFEPYFLKVELIVMILTFAIGVFVHPVHKIVALGLNLTFITICIVGLNGEYPLSKFLFYAILVSGSGYVGYLLHMSFIRLGQKIKNANSMIRLHNRELKEINKSKDDLLEIIGHDLKTPFAQLISLMELLKEASNEAEKEEIKRMMKESATKGNELLQGLLNWTSTQSLKKFMKLENALIVEVVREVAQFLENSYRSKDIRLTNNIASDLTMRMDKRMMETVFRNLISNAIKFSSRNSEIRIESRIGDGEVILSVIDCGVGMDEEMIRNLFKEERNESRKGTENESGTGFGLSICRKMIESQYGKMCIKSELNKGTTVEVIMPLI